MTNQKKEYLKEFLEDEALITTFFDACVTVSKRKVLTEDVLYNLLEGSVEDIKHHRDLFEDFMRDKRCEEAEHGRIAHGESLMQAEKEDNG